MEEGGRRLFVLSYHHLYYHLNFCFLSSFFFLAWHGPAIAHPLQAFREGWLVEKAMNKYSYVVYVIGPRLVSMADTVAFLLQASTVQRSTGLLATSMLHQYYRGSPK